MQKKPSGPVPEGLTATREEVDKAVESLNDFQLLRLRKFAAWRIRGLGRAAQGREAEDLLGEALASTLAGAGGSGKGRRWNKSVDFLKHLTEAMRSISHHWRQSFDEHEARVESELIAVSPAGDERSPLDGLQSNEPGADRLLLAKEEVGQIFSLFREDDEAILVLEGWIERMTGTEIMDLGFTRQQYDAAVKRIRYAVRKTTKR